MGLNSLSSESRQSATGSTDGQRSGRQICPRDHGEHTNPWSVKLCSCPFIQRIKSVCVIVGLGFHSQGSVSGGESRKSLSLPLAQSLSLRIVHIPPGMLNIDLKIIRVDLLLHNTVRISF